MEYKKFLGWRVRMNIPTIYSKMSRAALKTAFVYLAVLTAGCTPYRADLATTPEIQQMRSRPRHGLYVVFVRSVEYNEKGLPIPGSELDERPTGLGDHFTIVRLKGDQPVISYDIVVTKQRPDLVKPLKAVYEWTGKGFNYGVQAADKMLRDDHGNIIIHPVETLALVVASPILSTAGGFVIGVGDSIRQGAKELSKVAINGEQVITCTMYEYDDSGRMVHMRMFTPDLQQELVRTEFTYEGSGTVPARTLSRSLVEGREREIK